jgi:predicted nucleic acid-binding protein
MGGLNLPKDGLVYLDANCFIYTVERIEPYCSLLAPAWQRGGGIITADLTLLEVLVKPFQSGDALLQSLYRELLNAQEVERVPLSPEILEQAALIRAETGIKTPDAIHAACGLARQCVLFISNDPGFRRLSRLPLVYLQEQIP